MRVLYCVEETWGAGSQAALPTFEPMTLSRSNLIQCNVNGALLVLAFNPHVGILIGNSRLRPPPVELCVGTVAAMKVNKVEERVAHRTAGKLAIDRGRLSRVVQYFTVAGREALERKLWSNMTDFILEDVHVQKMRSCAS